MLNEILKVGGIFDWISPLWAGIQDLRNGPSHTFFIPYGCGWSGNDVIRLLRSRGVNTWGHMVVNDQVMITVKKKQARWAAQVMDRSGVPWGSAP